MAFRCLACGGSFPADETCRERFERALALEFANPAYFAVHHLSVPAYLLQHNAYSRQGWLWTRRSLAEFVRDGQAPAAWRRRQRPAVDSGNRTWSITKGPKPEWFDQIVWTRTIADVRFDTAAGYGADVRAWAASVLADTDAVVREHTGGEADP